MFHASLPTIAVGHRPFHLLGGGKQLMQEHHFSAFLHQFPDLYRRPGLKPGRIQMKRKELTTDPRFSDVCRQSSIFFAIFSLIKVWFRSKNHFFSSGFPASKTSSRLLTLHLALIYPAAAGKLTTKPRGRAFRRQFLLLFQKGNKLEAFPEYL